MRDILVSLVIVYLLLRTLRKLEYGAYLWTWLSLMNPHRLAYGFAVTLPWAQLSAITTFVAMVFSRERKPLPLNVGVVALILLWLWMTLTAVTSINPPDLVWERWIFVSKINLMLLVTLMLLRGRQQIDRLIWVVALSVGFFGIKGGVFTIGTGGSYRVWGPPGSMLEENNALAIGLIIVLPLFYYLRETVTERRLRPVLLVAMLLLVASILGSQSRGALVALMAMGLFLGLKSKHPLRFGLGAVLVLALGIVFMPDAWMARMDTIGDHENEGSAMSRIYTWQTLWNVAVSRPLVGAGFRADTIEIFARFAPTDFKYEAFRGNAWVAHSIYMQALGEHGFVGLLLFLLIWVWIWVACSRLAKQAERIDSMKNWAPLLLRMCQVSTVGYCVGGAFLSLMNADLPYYILLFVTLVKCAIQDRQLETAQGAVQPPRPMGPLAGRGPVAGVSQGPRR
jgi:probable O-glycosylation ligase (exosortase A-associated)